MTIKHRPDFAIRLTPSPCRYSRSDGINRVAEWGPKAGLYSSESSSGVRRRKPKESWIDPTPYTFRKTEIRAADGTCTYMPSGYPANNGQKFVGIVGTVRGDSATRFDLDNTFDPLLNEWDAIQDGGLRNVALIAARNKLKSSNVDLGVAFAERKQTAGLVGDTATRIAKSFNHLKRGNTRRAMDELGISSRRNQPRGSNVPKKWLEMQYGWGPLLSDIYGSCDSLATRDKDDWRVTAKAFRSRVDHYTGVRDPDGPARCLVAAELKRSVFVRIDAVPQNEAIISLASLGILNPLNVAWERVYLSFVVDWFVPVGSYLDSLDAMFGYETRAFSSSLLCEGEWQAVALGRHTVGSTVIENSWTGGTKKLKYLDRQVGGVVPLPSLPRFKDPRSLGHMANGLALLAGAFGRR